MELNPIPRSLPLFAGYGIEVEYMIVSRETGAVLPIADRVIAREAGEIVNSLERGEIGWSNELVLHVIELKTNGPAPSLEPLAGLFTREVRHINDLLQEWGGRLMPTAMHPWMNPDLETVLWPHDDSEIYETFNRIFDCRGHGWSNLQSMHINLPFADDEEFRRLHTAIRTLLPIMPAIAASSPLLGGDLTGYMDTRLETYRHNACRVPEVTGLVIPEYVAGHEEYLATILEPMYEAIAPDDPDGILRFEWLNSRGAIARFDRNAVEIRVLDTQESAPADLAVAGAVCAVVKDLTAQRRVSINEQSRLSTEDLAAIFLDNVRNADKAVIRSRDYLKLFRFPEKDCTAGELWQFLAESIREEAGASGWREGLRFILNRGCLARRIVQAAGSSARRSRVEETGRVLCDCLQEGKFFEGI